MTPCDRPSLLVYLAPAVTFALGIAIGILIRSVVARPKLPDGQE